MSTNVKFFEPVGFCANSYALESENDIALVDIGSVTRELEDYLKRNGERVRYILLTHDHYDHICGVNAAKKLCGNAKVVVCSLDKSGLTDSSYSLCDMAWIEQPQITADITVEDESRLPFANGGIRVLHTPGHTDGSVCYIFENIMFSGDTLFCGSVGRTDFITGSGEQMISSLQRLASLSGDYTIYCGHGESTRLSYEKQTNPYFNEL